MTVDFTKRDSARTTPSSQAASYDMGLRKHMIQVYNHMAIGVLITGLISLALSNSSDAVLQMMFGTPLRYVIMFAPLVFIMFGASKIQGMSAGTARTTFYLFAAIMGVSLTSIFLVYTQTSITRVFFITAGAFGALSLYGYTTKKDLTGMGSFLMMGLFGIIIASVVNIFLQSSALHYAVSFIGILIFAGLTAYDTQKIKNIYRQVGSAGNSAIIGALTLYLDFINLMVMLLQFFGDRR
jgi:FtsH-binding integral membrane protein